MPVPDGGDPGARPCPWVPSWCTGAGGAVRPAPTASPPDRSPRGSGQPRPGLTGLSGAEQGCWPQGTSAQPPAGFERLCTGTSSGSPVPRNATLAGEVEPGEVHSPVQERPRCPSVRRRPGSGRLPAVWAATKGRNVAAEAPEQVTALGLCPPCATGSCASELGGPRKTHCKGQRSAGQAHASMTGLSQCAGSLLPPAATCGCLALPGGGHPGKGAHGLYSLDARAPPNCDG